MAGSGSEAMIATTGKLTISDAVRIKTAEMWLRLSKPKRALRELSRLTQSAWHHTRIQELVWRAAKVFASAEHPPAVRSPRRTLRIVPKTGEARSVCSG